jgi:hypothetical protein
MRLRPFLLGFLLFSGTAQADFITFQKWLAMDKTSRAIYIAGDIDGTLTTLIGGAASKHFSSCLSRSGATTLNISEAVLEFAKDKPQLHMGGVHEILMMYLFKACGLPPEK